MNPHSAGGGFGGFGEGGSITSSGMLSMSVLQSLEQMMGGGSGEYAAGAVSGGVMFDGVQEQMAAAALAGGAGYAAQGADHGMYRQSENRASAMTAQGRSDSRGAGRAQASSSNGGAPSRYESQKRRDWNTFGQYLNNHRPPLALSRCSGAHVLEFLKYLDKFGKTKVHALGCPFFGHPQPPAPCACPLRQAWGSLDALIGRLRAAYEENGGKPESNPFGARAVRLYLREVRETQAKARGIAYEKKKRKRPTPPPPAPPAAASFSTSAAPRPNFASQFHPPAAPPPASSSALDHQSLFSDSSSLLIPSLH